MALSVDHLAYEVVEAYALKSLTKQEEIKKGCEEGKCKRWG
jgi:hypothetical protein